MIAASDLGGLLGTIFFIALLVGLKLLEVIFRKITEAKHGDRLGQGDVRIIEEEAPPAVSAVEPPPRAGGPYLPYEETAEEIFGDYIKLRKRVAEPKRPEARPVARPRPRPAPARPIPVTEIVEDAVVLAEPRAAASAPSRRRAAMSAEEARRAFIASLIFGPPKSRARGAGSR